MKKNRISKQLLLLFLSVSIIAVPAHLLGYAPWRESFGTAFGIWLFWLMHDEIDHLHELFLISDRQLVLVSQQVTNLQCEIIDLRNELEEVRNSKLLR